MRRQRLLWYLYPSYFLITLISLLAVTWYASRSLSGFYRDSVKADLLARAQLLEPPVARYLAQERFEPLDRLCKKLGKSTATRITVILPSGKVVADSHKDPREMDSHADRPEIRQALGGATGFSTRFSPTLKKELSYVALPLQSHEGVIGVLRTSLPLTAINRPLHSIQFEFLLGGLVVAALAAVISLLVARRISRPLEEMKQGAERFAQGDLAHPLPVPATREMGGLAEALNRMAEQLNEKIRTVSQQRGEQEAILSSMVEGVLAVDADERLISLNRSAAEAFGLDPAEALGRNVLEVVRHTELQRFISNTLRRREPQEGEIVLHEAEERFFQAHGTVLRDGRGAGIGALIVLNDVTRLRRLENVRRDFVANVSHELKTPITSIKGFVETLQEGFKRRRPHAMQKPDDTRRFLSIIARQADRLNAIINDLLTLSRLEQDSEKNRLALKPARIAEVLEGAIQACEMRTSAKRVTPRVSCPATLTARVNAHLLEQAVINLLDNAAKYSDEGSTVEIEAAISGGELLIKVTDHGCGIEPDHLPRLFERFYRVDKARSRKLGGTGLGLAIVKHIIQIHGGRVAVESAPGRGSVFFIHLPMKE